MEVMTAGRETQMVPTVSADVTTVGKETQMVPTVLVECTTVGKETQVAPTVSAECTTAGKETQMVPSVSVEYTTVGKETQMGVMFWDGSVLNDENCYTQNSSRLNNFRTVFSVDILTQERFHDTIFA
jgi:hypothetical protein